jgi:glutamate/tyrosine decarboxylase-like PLP-dependent enzyme
MCDRGRYSLREEKDRTGKPGLQMGSEEMRRLGYEVVDRIVERWSTLSEGPAWEGGTHQELSVRLSGPPPEEGRDPDQVLSEALTEILPRAGRVDHPRFFAFIPSSPTWPAVLGDFLATGFNIFQGTWLESAGPSQVELTVVDWIREWIGIPEGGGGILTSGGSAANLIALVTARHWAGDPSNPVVYVSDQGHSSLERAARIAGISPLNIRRIPTDSDFRVRVGAVRNEIGEDRSQGRSPLCICGNAGATNTGAIDPLGELAALARDEGVWLHVDGAYGGFARLVPETHDSFRGIEEADSVTLDPHKWLFQPYEAGCLLVRDTHHLENAFRVLPEYLQDTALGAEQVNFADRGIQLTRSFRALKVWMSVQMLGVAAFREAIRGSMGLADAAAKSIRESPWLELTAPPSLGVVCFRFRPPGTALEDEELEELNLQIQSRVVESGIAMMSSTRLRGRLSLRLCILNYRSTWTDVRETLEAVESLGVESVEGLDHD